MKTSFPDRFLGSIHEMMALARLLERDNYDDELYLTRDALHGMAGIISRCANTAMEAYARLEEARS